MENSLCINVLVYFKTFRLTWIYFAAFLQIAFNFNGVVVPVKTHASRAESKALHFEVFFICDAVMILLLCVSFF